MKNRYFNNNEEYFKFFNKMRDEIEVVKVTVGNKIRIQYRKVDVK